MISETTMSGHDEACLSTWTVLYAEAGCVPGEVPLAFLCRAEDKDHAQEQCRNAYPDCEVVFTAQTGSLITAYDAYYLVVSRQ